MLKVSHPAMVTVCQLWLSLRAPAGPPSTKLNLGRFSFMGCVMCYSESEHTLVYEKEHTFVVAIVTLFTAKPMVQ